MCSLYRGTLQHPLVILVTYICAGQDTFLALVTPLVILVSRGLLLTVEQ